MISQDKLIDEVTQIDTDNFILIAKSTLGYKKIEE